MPCVPWRTHVLHLPARSPLHVQHWDTIAGAWAVISDYLWNKWGPAMWGCKSRVLTFGARNFLDLQNLQRFILIPYNIGSYPPSRGQLSPGLSPLWSLPLFLRHSYPFFFHLFQHSLSIPDVILYHPCTVLSIGPWASCQPLHVTWVGPEVPAFRLFWFDWKNLRNLSCFRISYNLVWRIPAKSQDLF